jgi:hypothetical protein
MKLELKHIAPYLPYGLKCLSRVQYQDKNDLLKFFYTLEKFEVFGIDAEYVVYTKAVSESSTLKFGCKIEDFKPILRPLSDAEIRLVKYEFLQLGLDTVFNWKNILLILRKDQLSLLPQSLFEVLIRLHVDVFGLIPQGLAIDINTLLND